MSGFSTIGGVTRAALTAGYNILFRQEPRRVSKLLVPLVTFVSAISSVDQADGAQLRSVQSKTTTLANGASSVTATITTVDTTKAFLVFSTSLASNVPADPQHGLVSGQITNSTTLTFARNSSGGDIRIKWYVAEFTSGVAVQRGSFSMSGSPPPKNVTLSPAVNTAKSFPLISFRASGGGYDADDFVQAKITSSTNLQLDASNNGPNKAVEWQVIEYTDANVTSGDVSFGTSDSSKPVTGLTINTSKAWLIYSYKSDSGTGADIGQKLVRGVMTNSSTLTFDRDNTGQAIGLTWYLVQFTDGTTVQHNSQGFTSAETTKPVTITPVDTTWDIAAGGKYMRGGKTPYSADNQPAVGFFRLDLTSSTNLKITRGITGSATANVGSFVVQFVPNPTTVKLSSFTATAHSDGVVLNWQTGYEVDNLGFHVYREENGERVRLTPEPIAGTALLAGAGTPLSSGQSYNWWDPDGNMADRYWLEDVDLSGQRTRHGPVKND